MKCWRHAGTSLLTGMLSALLMSTNVDAQATVTVVEYMNTQSNVRFITGRADEQTLLDSTPSFKRTGSTFLARPASAASGNFQPVCRYRIQLTPSYATHFYGLPADCAFVQDAINRGLVNNFFSEGLDFAVEPAVNGSCPSGSPVPVRRALRLGTPVEASNHRYATTAGDYQDALVQGWTGENIVFCVASATPETARPDFSANLGKQNFCEVPRTGVSPRTGQAYPDVQGARQDEKDYIQAWVDRSYLWYREVPNPTTSDGETVSSYFAKLKSPAVAVAGGMKDRFSGTTSTASVDNTNAGVVFGYGITWSAQSTIPPRRFVASVVAPNSPAAIAGVRRGDSIVSIDGADFVFGNNLTTLNRGLSPPVVGESHTFVLQPADGSANKTVVLQSASLPLISVPVSGVLNTPTGKVGYIAFTTFNSFTAEKAIADAVAGLAPQGISDLVLDLRYNGGGYIFISAQTGYMIAGPSRTNGKAFETTKSNDKKPFGPDDVYPFYNVGSGFPGGVTSGSPLPTLNLPRVFILTTGQSCSASESLINGLRGIDVEVILIGGTTCGKPYGFIGRDNCGTTYYPIQFTGVNHKNEGDFINGFAARCAAADDLTKPLGDPSERMLATALNFRQTGTCSAPTSSTDAFTLKAGARDAFNAGLADFPDLQAQSLKLLVPADTRRDGNGVISPRVPLDLDQTFGATRAR